MCPFHENLLKVPLGGAPDAHKNLHGILLSERHPAVNFEYCHKLFLLSSQTYSFIHSFGWKEWIASPLCRQSELLSIESDLYFFLRQITFKVPRFRFLWTIKPTWYASLGAFLIEKLPFNSSFVDRQFSPSRVVFLPSRQFEVGILGFFWSILSYSSF